MARYMFRIYYAEGLPKMSTDTVGKVKKVFTGNVNCLQTVLTVLTLDLIKEKTKI